MAYRNLYKPLSQFVDPGSTEIAEVLKNKYLAAYQTSDQTGQALSELTVADFANDQKLYNDLYNNTRSALDAIAERGDYENMFVPVNTLARQYRESATPLANNYSRYMTDVQEKQKLLEEGKITKKDYDGWSRRSKLRMGEDDYEQYGGLEMDESGKINNNSYYSPTQIAQYVDIQGEIIDTLNKIPEVKEGGYEVKMIGSAADFEETAGRYPADMQFAITKQGQIVEGIPPNVVAAVTRQVLDRPDVAAYMEQSADFSTLDMDEQSMNQILAREIAMLKDEDSPEARSSADVLTNILQTGSTGTKRRAVRAAKINNERVSYMGTALASRQPSVYGGKNITSFEASLTEKLKETNGNANTWTPKFPGEQGIAEPLHIMDEDNKVTHESVRANMNNLEVESLAINQSLLEVVPGLAMWEQKFGQPINLSASTDELVNKAKMMDPSATEPEIRLAIEQARTAQANNTAGVRASEQLLRNSYEDFGEQALNEIVSSIAIELEVVAPSLSDHFENMPIENTYTYDEGSNTVQIKAGGGDGDESSRDAWKLAVLNKILTDRSVKLRSNVLKDAGADENEFNKALASNLFGVPIEEAEEVIQAATALKVVNLGYGGEAYSPTPAPYGMDPLQPGVSSSSPAGARFMADDLGVSSLMTSIIESTFQGAAERSQDWLSKRNEVQYTTGVTDRAIGDRNGKISETLTKGFKGKQMLMLAGSEIVPTVTSRTVNKDGLAVRDFVDDPSAVIKTVTFTDYYNGATRTMDPALTFEYAGTGDEGQAGRLTIPYDAAVLEFNPRLKKMIMNTYDSVGGDLIRKAQAGLFSYPGLESYVMEKEIGNTQVKFEFIPKINPAADEGIDIVAGIDRVIVTPRGKDAVVYDDIGKFIKAYNVSILDAEGIQPPAEQTTDE